MNPFPPILTPYGPLELEDIASMLETTVDHIQAEFVLDTDSPVYFDLSLTP